MSYPGGKNGAGVYQKIINLMPPHDRYFEPFLGNGAIMRLKKPARHNYGCDLVGSQVAAVQYSIASCAGTGSNIGGTVAPLAAGGDGEPEYSFLHVSAFAILERASLFTAGDLVYCDPPYLLETRKGRRLYKYELSSIDHHRLLRCLRLLPCMVMVSGYWSEMYAAALHDWNIFHFQAMTRGGTMADEYVWFNFPRPTALHDYAFLGVGYRERERIKKKNRRWVAMLTRMPLLERQALLSAIADTRFQEALPNAEFPATTRPDHHPSSPAARR